MVVATASEGLSSFDRHAPRHSAALLHVCDVTAQYRPYSRERQHCRQYEKGSPYSITERRVPELIPVLGSQPAGDVNIGVNSYWAQGLKPPHFYDHGARLYDEPPHFCDVILSKLCFNCPHWFYAMPTNRQLDHSFPHCGKGAKFAGSALPQTPIIGWCPQPLLIT